MQAVLVPEAAPRESTEAEVAPPTPSEPVDFSDNADDDSGAPAVDDDPPNQGQLLLDATVAPADIHYPTDLHLLNQARASSERILDQL